MTQPALRRARPWLAALTLGLTCGALGAWAGAAGLVGTVQNAQDVAPRVAKSGKAWVKPLPSGKNAFIAQLRLAPGAAVPLHRDATEEYIYILEGAGTVHIEGKAHAVKPGSLIFMPANAAVSFKNDAADLVGLQVFAGRGPEVKYDTWTAAKAR